MPVKNGKRETIIFIVGPTATGKTSLAVALAHKVNGEIVSCDSMQVYKSMDMLSQAPTKLEKRIVRHHLVSFLDPKREYSVASFRRAATIAIKSILKKKMVPIVAGGSGLYMKALIDGLFVAPPEDPEFRMRLQRFASRYGALKLHERLFKVDPDAAGLIHVNDVRRTIRALEIFKSTGRTMTELKATTKGLKDHYRIKIFGLNTSRKTLYSRIDSRVDQIFASGAVAEAKKLSRRKISRTAGAVLGLKEISGYLSGEHGLETAKDMVKMNTRRYAKRQLTWFRSDRRVRWCNITRNTQAKIIKRIIREAL